MPSKLGPHSLRTRPELIEFVRSGGRLVKLVSDLPVDSLLEVNPDLLIIGRVYDPLTALEQLNAGESPEDSARRFVEMQTEKYRANPQVVYWEGHNEPSFGAPEDPEAVRKMAWYGEHEAARVRLLAEMDLKAVVANFATGYPEVQNNNALWEAFLPALRAAHEHKGLLGVHEYGGPFMWSLTGPYVAGNCNTEPVDDDSGWLTLRYRKVHRQILAPNGMANLPIVITENGTDRVGTFCEPFVSGAWHDLIETWNGWDGSTDPIDYWRGPERDPERYYAEQMKWYDREMQKDDYCVGSCIFTLGNYGPPWADFEISGTRVVKSILEHVKGDPWQGPHDPWAAGGSATTAASNGTTASPKTARPATTTPATTTAPTAGSGDIAQDYVDALNSRNPDTVAMLYNERAALVSSVKTVAGTAGISDFYAAVFQLLPGASFQLVGSNDRGNSVTVQWTARWATGSQAFNDTLQLRDGRIQYHASSFR